jgi:hypothetical protein
MKRRVAGSLMLTLLTGVTVMSTAAAGAAPIRGAATFSETVPCYAGPAAGPIVVTEQVDIRTRTVGETTIEVGTVRITNLGNGRAHTFYEVGTVTDLGPPTTSGPFLSNDFVLRGSLIWAPRDDLNYVVGTATTAGGMFNQITSHTGQLSEACESVA